jgi:kynurenine formamidase
MNIVRIVDLSVPMDNDAGEPDPPHIEYLDHDRGAQQAADWFGLTKEDFPDGKAWANEYVKLSVHTGTHVDAPHHYAPTSGGKRSRTIDELPLEWFFADGVVLDFSNKAAGETIDVEDIERELMHIDYTLKPFDIVMIRTDTDKKFYQKDYASQHAGMSANATRYLIKHGIKVMGIDGWGWDIPFRVQAERYKTERKSGILWAAHFVGKEAEYCQIEKLANLDKLPPYGFKVAAFPVKIKGAGAGWARPVAIFLG